MTLPLHKYGVGDTVYALPSTPTSTDVFYGELIQVVGPKCRVKFEPPASWGRWVGRIFTLDTSLMYVFRTKEEADVLQKERQIEVDKIQAKTHAIWLRMGQNIKFPSSVKLKLEVAKDE